MLFYYMQIEGVRMETLYNCEVLFCCFFFKLPNGYGRPFVSIFAKCNSLSLNFNSLSLNFNSLSLKTNSHSLNFIRCR